MDWLIKNINEMMTETINNHAAAENHQKKIRLNYASFLKEAFQSLYPIHLFYFKSV